MLKKLLLITSLGLTAAPVFAANMLNGEPVSAMSRESIISTYIATKKIVPDAKVNARLAAFNGNPYSPAVLFSSWELRKRLSDLQTDLTYTVAGPYPEQFNAYSVNIDQLKSALDKMEKTNNAYTAYTRGKVSVDSKRAESVYLRSLQAERQAKALITTLNKDIEAANALSSYAKELKLIAEITLEMALSFKEKGKQIIIESIQEVDTPLLDSIGIDLKK